MDPAEQTTLKADEEMDLAALEADVAALEVSEQLCACAQERGAWRVGGAARFAALVPGSAHTRAHQQRGAVRAAGRAHALVLCAAQNEESEEEQEVERKDDATSAEEEAPQAPSAAQEQPEEQHGAEQAGPADEEALPHEDVEGGEKEALAVEGATQAAASTLQALAAAPAPAPAAKPSIAKRKALVAPKVRGRWLGECSSSPLRRRTTCLARPRAVPPPAMCRWQRLPQHQQLSPPTSLCPRGPPRRRDWYAPPALYAFEPAAVAR